MTPNQSLEPTALLRYASMRILISLFSAGADPRAQSGGWLLLVRSMQRVTLISALVILCSSASAQTGAGGFVYGKEGSAIHPVKKPSIKTNIGRLVGEVYHFGPDQRGQYDARAYFTYKGYIDYFVLTARNKATFQKSLSAFEHIVRSYAPQLKVTHEPAQ
jgi:hypothetical protein